MYIADSGPILGLAIKRLSELALVDKRPALGREIDQRSHR